ncbi:hypothetical protein B7463_g7917, partial [Scytalidium lignicola]
MRTGDGQNPALPFCYAGPSGDLGNWRSGEMGIRGTVAEAPLGTDIRQPSNKIASSYTKPHLSRREEMTDIMSLNYNGRSTSETDKTLLAKSFCNSHLANNASYNTSKGNGTSAAAGCNVPNISVLFICYSFLNAQSLPSLEPQEAAFLEARGCLHVPSGQVLDTFVRHYFLYVHPSLPLIDEAEFWKIYRGEDSSRCIPLLLFKAMLFAAACLLYDFKIERDNFVIAQAALLLSYHSSSSDQLSNTTWLTVAIQNARFENAHQYDYNPITTTIRRKKSDLKRLWWCCCLRDRNLAISLRRPLQITTDNFNFNQGCLTTVDLEGEIYHSSVYSPDIKTDLSKIVVSHCQLAVAVTKLVVTVYPAKGFDHSKLRTKDELIERLHILDDARSLLDQWKRSSVISSDFLPGNVHTSVLLNTIMISLHYYKVPSDKRGSVHYVATDPNKPQCAVIINVDRQGETRAHPQ